MAGNQSNRGRRSNYGESWAGVWVVIIAVGGILTLIGATGPVAIVLGAGAVIAFFVATSKR
jgi:hypothetical protein